MQAYFVICLSGIWAIAHQRKRTISGALIILFTYQSTYQSYVLRLKPLYIIPPSGQARPKCTNSYLPPPARAAGVCHNFTNIFPYITLTVPTTIHIYADQEPVVTLCLYLPTWHHSVVSQHCPPVSHTDQINLVPNLSSSCKCTMLSRETGKSELWPRLNIPDVWSASCNADHHPTVQPP